MVSHNANQSKLENYPFVDMIDDGIQKWWKSLRDQNINLKTPLFTKKKYEALTRTAPFSEFEEEGFINRQLVETHKFKYETLEIPFNMYRIIIY